MVRCLYGLADLTMSGMHAFRSVLASAITLVMMTAVPAYSGDGSRSITSLVLDPLVPTTLYAGTADRGVFKSTDGGLTWSPTGLTGTPVGALAIDPILPSSLYAVTPTGVLKSSNGGGTWTATALMNELISSPTWDLIEKPMLGTVGSLAIVPRAHPQAPATLLVGVTYTAFDAFNDFVWGEVLASRDGDEGWGTVLPYHGDPWAIPWMSAPYLAVAPQTQTTPVTIYTSGVYDYHVCWIRDATMTGCARLNSNPEAASVLVVDPQNPHIVYVGTNGLGVYKSVDAGATWGSGGSGAVWTLAVNPLTPATLYAGTADQGVLKSTDGGATWTAVNTGLTSYVEALGLETGIRALAIDPLIPATLYAGTAAGVFKSTDGGGTWSATGLVQHSALASLSVSPDIVTHGTASTGTVTLVSVAPVGGTAVTLSSTDTAVASVPASVTVPAGATSASFAIPTGPVGGVTPVTISATLDDGARSAVLYVVPALKYSSLSPYRIPGGIASTGTVALGVPAPADGAVVALSSSSAAAAVSATVTVAPGATSASFTVYTSAVTAVTVATITAAYGGDTRYMSLEIVPTTISSLSLNPTSVTAGSPSTGTVTLSVPAPAGGAVVTLSLSGSHASFVTVPASVTVAAGATSASFTVSTSPVLPPTYSGIAVSIQGAIGGASASRGLMVTLPPATTLSSLSFDRTSVTGGTALTGTAILSAAAPAGGAIVALSSSNPAVATVPASVTVPTGSTSVNFAVSTIVCTSGSATVSGTYGGAARSAGLAVTSSVDNVSIQLADYFTGKRQLRLAATSTSPTATLQVFVTSSGALIGTLSNNGGGAYTGQFSWPVKPQNIRVQSSLCGTATKQVTRR